MSQHRTNRNNRIRGKFWERRAAQVLGGRRNLDKSRPHTDVETAFSVYEIKSTKAPTPVWLDKATSQLNLASAESEKTAGGVVKVWTNNGGNARAFLITEIDLNAGS